MAIGDSETIGDGSERVPVGDGSGLTRTVPNWSRTVPNCHFCHHIPRLTPSLVVEMLKNPRNLIGFSVTIQFDMEKPIVYTIVVCIQA